MTVPWWTSLIAEYEHRARSAWVKTGGFLVGPRELLWPFRIVDAGPGAFGKTERGASSGA